MKTTRAKRDQDTSFRTIQVETTPMSKDEIVHDKRPDGADAILERVRNEHLNTPLNAPNSKVLRRQKTRDKLILARDMITTPNWESGEKPTVHIDESTIKSTTSATTTNSTLTNSTTTEPKK